MILVAKIKTSICTPLSSFNDETARIWEVKTGNQLLELKGHSSGVSDLDFNFSGTQLVTSSWDGIARVWDARNGTSGLDFTSELSTDISGSLHPLQSLLATTDRGNAIRFWVPSPAQPNSRHSRRSLTGAGGEGRGRGDSTPHGPHPDCPLEPRGTPLALASPSR